MSSSWLPSEIRQAPFRHHLRALPSFSLLATFCHGAYPEFFNSLRVFVTGSVLPHFNFPFHVMAGRRFHLLPAIYRDFSQSLLGVEISLFSARIRMRWRFWPGNSTCAGLAIRVAEWPPPVHFFPHRLSADNSTSPGSAGITKHASDRFQHR